MPYRGYKAAKMKFFPVLLYPAYPDIAAGMQLYPTQPSFSIPIIKGEEPMPFYIAKSLIYN
jgi:hypothetical protein